MLNLVLKIYHLHMCFSVCALSNRIHISLPAAYRFTMEMFAIRLVNLK